MKRIKYFTLLLFLVVFTGCSNQPKEAEKDYEENYGTTNSLNRQVKDLETRLNKAILTDDSDEIEKIDAELDELLEKLEIYK